MEDSDDVLISYGDIIYNEKVLKKILKSNADASIIVDDGWYGYWSESCENPLDDAETLMFDKNDYLTEIGQKTTDLSKVQSQYIGLMRFKNNGLRELLALSTKAEQQSEVGEVLWKHW